MTTTIGPHTRITGRITGDADLLVEGAVDGHIELNSNLVIAAGGSVSGNIRAISVRIEGRLEGILEAAHVHLTSTAQVIAEQLTATLLQMEDGARIKGEIVMSLDGTATTPVAKAAPVQKPVARPAPAIQPRPTAAPVAAPVVSRPSPTPAAAALAPQTTTTTVVVEEVEEVEEIEEIEESFETAPATSSNSAYDAMTVKELRDRLRELDLPLSGTKQELAERLAEAES